MDIGIINTWLIIFEGKGLGIIRNGALGIEDGKITYGKFLNIDENLIIKEANLRAQRIFEDAAEDWLKAGSKMVYYHKQGFI